MNRPAVTLEPLSASLPLLLDRKTKSEQLATGFGHDLAECFCGPSPRQEIVDDDYTLTRWQHPSRHFDPVLHTLGGGSHLSCEGIAIAGAEVLLGVYHRHSHRMGTGHRRGNPGSLCGEDQIRPMIGKDFGQLLTNRCDDFGFDPMVEELIDQDEVSLDPGSLGNSCSQIHEEDRSRPCSGGENRLRLIAMPATNPLDQELPQRRRSARIVLKRLVSLYPDMGTALEYTDAWQLLVSTVLSAQTTDENVNRVTPELFARWPTPEDLAAANPEEVEQVVYSTGFYRQKTKSILALAGDIVANFAGEVPRDLDAMVTLRGVGRKTASVVLAEVWGDPAIAVDTHVNRVARRLGLTANTDPEKIESDLKNLFLKETWAGISMRFIQFGRDVCDARTPRCWDCPLRDRCPYEPKTRRRRVAQ